MSHISSALAQSGKIESAIQTAKEKGYGNDRSEALSSIALALAQSGKIDESFIPININIKTAFLPSIYFLNKSF